LQVVTDHLFAQGFRDASELPGIELDEVPAAADWSPDVRAFIYDLVRAVEAGEPAAAPNPPKKPRLQDAESIPDQAGGAPLLVGHSGLLCMFVVRLASSWMSRG